MRISPFSFARDRSLRFAPWCGLACDTTKGCSARGRGGLGKVMRGAGRQSCRWGLVTVLSLGLHAAITAWLAGSTAPVLRDDGPDLPLMTIELTPPDAESPQAKVSRRAFVASASVSSPVPGAPTLSAAPGDVAPAAPALTASPGVAPPSDALRAALRAGGCLRGASLSREERERCEERLGRLQAATPSYPAAMDPAKRVLRRRRRGGPLGRGLRRYDARRGQPGRRLRPFHQLLDQVWPRRQAEGPARRNQARCDAMRRADTGELLRARGQRSKALSAWPDPVSPKADPSSAAPRSLPA